MRDTAALTTVIATLMRSAGRFTALHSCIAVCQQGIVCEMLIRHIFHCARLGRY